MGLWAEREIPSILTRMVNGCYVSAHDESQEHRQPALQVALGAILTSKSISEYKMCVLTFGY